MLVSKFFCFHPENWGNDPNWLICFSNGLKPPTSQLVNCESFGEAKFCQVSGTRLGSETMMQHDGLHQEEDSPFKDCRIPSLCSNLIALHKLWFHLSVSNPFCSCFSFCLVNFVPMTDLRLWYKRTYLHEYVFFQWGNVPNDTRSHGSLFWGWSFFPVNRRLGCGHLQFYDHSNGQVWAMGEGSASLWSNAKGETSTQHHQHEFFWSTLYTLPETNSYPSW